jgi:hypothetical protein
VFFSVVKFLVSHDFTTRDTKEGMKETEEQGNTAQKKTSGLRRGMDNALQPLHPTALMPTDSA